MPARKSSVAPVLIVGAGPAGMVSALALAQCGIRSIVIEKRKTVAIHPKAHEINGRTLEILRQLHIPESEFLKEASSQECASTIFFGVTANEKLASLRLVPDATHFSSKPYLNISQTEVEKVLRRFVEKNRLITFRTGLEVTAIRATEKEVIVEAAELSGGAITEWRAPYLLCCDGALSPCRKMLGIGMTGPEKIQDFANAYFEADLTGAVAENAKLFFVFRPDAAGTFIAHHPEKRWVYHFPLITPYEKIDDFTTEEIRSRILRALGRDDIEISVKSVQTWRMTAQVAETFRRGRAFLVGDSAHRFPPTGGLGLNSGVADAFNLCFKLALVLRGRADEKILESYEAERKPVIRRFCDESEKNFRNLLQVPAVFGLSLRPLEFLHRFFAAFPGRLFSVKLRRKVFGWAFRAGSRMLHRYRRNPALLARAVSVIERQRPHFDRTGIDLGYHYLSGFLDAASAEPERSSTTTYVPSFSAGARLPLFPLGESKNSHTALSYRKFTFFYPAGSAAWKKKLADLAAFFGGSGPGDFKWVPVPGKFPVPGKAFLVRPDGHIAALWPEESSAAEILSFLTDSGLLFAAERKKLKVVAGRTEKPRRKAS